MGFNSGFKGLRIKWAKHRKYVDSAPNSYPTARGFESSPGDLLF